MNIVKPYAKLIGLSGGEFTSEMGLALLRHIEWAARVSHRSEDLVTPESWRRFIQHVVMEKGDWSVVEHASATVDALVDRGITHEWVRHRLASYTQESTRFCNYGKKGGAITVIQPDLSGDPAELWEIAARASEVSYLTMLDKGVSPQIARSVLPNSLASRIVTTSNLRQWRHFFIMRTCKQAHPQMREVTLPLLAEFKAKIPLLYDDIVPEEQQNVSMAKIR